MIALYCLFLNKDDFFFRVILGSQQNWEGGIEVSCVLFAPAHV